MTGPPGEAETVVPLATVPPLPPRVAQMARPVAAAAPPITPIFTHLFDHQLLCLERSCAVLRVPLIMVITVEPISFPCDAVTWTRKVPIWLLAVQPTAVAWPSALLLTIWDVLLSDKVALGPLMGKRNTTS